MGKGVALLLLVAGAVLGAAALDMLPPGYSRHLLIHAPRKVLGIAGGVLGAIGLVSLSRDHRGSDLVTAFILLGISVLTGWVTFYGPEAVVEGSLEKVPPTVRESLGQLMFGLGVVVCGLTAFFGLRRLVR